MSEKFNSLQEFKDNLAVRLFGPTKDGCCVICKTEVDPDLDFRDDVSRKEWEISKRCQDCQDDFYLGPQRKYGNK
jgi:hypothetical protein